MRVLFVTWDGPTTRYLESLFLPIFARLRAAGVEVHVVQFGWGEERHVHAVAAAAERIGIRYHFRPVRKHGGPLGIAATLLTGTLWITRYVRRVGIDVVMPRSIIPAAMTLAARAIGTRARLVYDADGLMADERIDFGGWCATDTRYRVLRRVERAAVRSADLVLVRTRRAAAILAERAAPDDRIRVSLVANGRDPSVYRPSSEPERTRVREAIGVGATAPLLVYAGSLGPQYHPDRMLAFFAEVHRRRPDARLLVLSSMPLDPRWMPCAGAARDAVCHRAVEPGAVATYLGAADLGVAFRMPSLSQQAVAPIKVGEYLLCGLPVVATTGVGDLDACIDASVGRLLPALDDDDLRLAGEWFVERVLPDRDAYRDRCRRAGVTLFGLSHTVRQYLDALDVAVNGAHHSGVLAVANRAPRARGAGPVRAREPAGRAQHG